ncbi:hypothetical protein ABNP34_03935 [Glutamicibacter mishrai]|uniref:hypothetical protein n=1 Tax=Glutamicibacter mishrai TaxID=1775880 RepID=UPI0003B71CDC
MVGTDDTIWAADYAAGKLASFTLDDDGTAVGEEQIEIPELSNMKKPQISAVGNTAVVFDEASGELLTSKGGKATLENAANARIQAPGPDSGNVAIALDQSLATVSLSGKDINYQQVDTAGTPHRPGASRLVHLCRMADQWRIPAILR